MNASDNTSNTTDNAPQNASMQTDPILEPHATAQHEDGPRTRRSGASERAIQAAIEIFTLWENDERNIPLDRITSSEFRTRKYLNSGERRWVAEAVYNCARFWRRQVFLLEARNQDATPENVVKLWAEQYAQERTAKPESETSSHSESKSETGHVATSDVAMPNNALPTLDTPHAYLRVALSFTDDMATDLEALLGDEAIAAAEAFNRQAPTTLRVNPLRVSWDHLRRSLPEATPTRYSPWGLELPHRVNVFDMPGFRTGWFEVQEEASQLVALLTDARPGQSIVEIGAGAGGKTLALAALMENKGEVFALDTSKLRLEELAKRAERAGVTCVQICEIAANPEGVWQPSVSVRRTVNRWSGRAHVVLLDAPCTGSGVLRRSPDAKWREFDIEQMTLLQRNLLAQAATLVCADGYLIYVTCAFERAQNEDVVASLLASEFGSQFEVVPAVPRLYTASVRARQQAETPPFLRTEKAQRKLAEKTPISGKDTAGSLAVTPPASLEDFESMASGSYLRTWPHLHGVDAFFAACLHRKPV